MFQKPSPPTTLILNARRAIGKPVPASTPGTRELAYAAFTRGAFMGAVPCLIDMLEAFMAA